MDENALLLFEILDHRPSLNFNKDQGIQGPRPYKQVCRVAWWSGVEWSGVERGVVWWSVVQCGLVECDIVEWSGVEWSGV